MKRLTISSFLVIALVALALMGARSLLGGGDTVHAIPAGTVDEVAIDMDPAVAPANPPNGALGTRQICVSKAVGAIFDIDVTVKGIDAADRMTGFSFDLGYDPTKLNVVGFDAVGQMIGANGGTVNISFTDIPPDADGTFVVAESDFGAALAESGDGVLARITLESVGAGVSPLTLSTVIIVDDIGPAAIGTITTIVNDAHEAQDEPCPLGQDLKNVSLDVDPGSFVPPLADINGDTVVNDVAVSTNYDYVLTDVYHNNGPGAASDIQFSANATPDEGIQVSYTCQAPLAEEITLNGQTIDPNCAPGTTYVANFPDTLDVHILLPPAPVSVPQILQLNFDLHCLEPSTHSILFDKEIQPTKEFVSDEIQGNNTQATVLTVDCIAQSDIKIVGHTVTPLLTTDTDGDTVNDAFLTGNSVDEDGDTQSDEDPINGVDDDGDTVTDEDGGDVLEIVITKDLHNNGPWGPTVVTDVLTALQANPFAGTCGVSMSNIGPFIPATGDFQQANLAVSVTDSTVSFSVYLNCGRSGFLVDDDGDAIHRTIPAALDADFDAFIDEDPPGDANGDGCPGVCGVDDDGDTLTDEGNIQDDDEDGLDDEDGPVALAALVTADCVDAKDPHIVDPAPDPNYLLLPTVELHGACSVVTTVLVGVLPFTPTATVTIDSTDPAGFTNAVSDECLVTVPCKMQWNYLIPGADLGGSNTHNNAGTARDGGAQPLAQSVLIETAVNGPFDFTITAGTAIPNGDVVSSILAQTTLKIPGLNTPCTSPVPLVFNLSDAKLPDTQEPFDLVSGWPDNTPDPLTALGNNASWPTKLDAFVTVILASSPPSTTLWAREVGVAVIGALAIPINMVVFDLGLGGPGTGPFSYAFTIGDPDNDLDGILDDLDPDDDNDGIPDAQDADADGDGTENSLELGQCSPLAVQLISLGTTAAGTNAISGQPTPGGTINRICNTISPLPPAGSGLIYASNFTREDIGQTVTVVDIVGCVGESDLAASIFKDEHPGDGVPANGVDTDGDTVADITPGIDNDADTQVDEDPTLDAVDDDNDGSDGEDPTDDVIGAGEEQHVQVVFDVENGAVPGSVNVTFAIGGPSACNPTWIGESGDTVNTIIIGPTQTSTIDRVEATMGANEVRYLVRKYSVTCPPGDHNLQIFNNVSSASGLPDPDTDNNQAENQLIITAIPDKDFDTVPNPNDNCNFAPNPAQTDTDSDGIGDACDIDDDGDDVPDVNDACPLLPEDLDSVDDLDGCPDTDVSIEKLVNNGDPIDVDVSETVTLSETVTVTNGNYPADIQTTITMVSLLGGCETRLIAEAGDAYIEFTTDTNADTFDDTLFSQIERADFFNAGEVKVFTRDFELHCFQRSGHTFENKVDAVALPPVVEEDVSDNVVTQFPAVTAWDVTDVKKVSWVFNNPPASIKVGQIVFPQILGTLHNNGPTSGVNVSDTANIQIPADCTGGPLTDTAPFGPLNTSVPLGNQYGWSIDCTEESDHTVTSDNCITITDLHVRDTDLSNNCAYAQWDFAVIADADLKVTDVTVNAPAQANTGDVFQVSVDATLHNNGPEDDVNATYTIGLSGPGDCNLVATGGQNGAINLPVSVPTVVQATWDVDCTDPSFHDFDGSASVAVAQEHVEDPDGGNNAGAGADQMAIFHGMEKIVCDIYFGLPPLPAAQTGPAAGCPAQNPWNGGPDNISTVPSTVLDLISDDLDFSSEPVNIKKTAVLEAIAGGPQICDVGDLDDEQLPQAIATQILQEAEPQGLSTQPASIPWQVHLPLSVHDGEPNWCVVRYTVTKEIKDLHVNDITTGDLTQTRDYIIWADTDGDGLPDNASPIGPIDPCKLDPTNQYAPTCQPPRDVGEKYIAVLGPGAVNLTDTNGRYMWVLGEMGNFSSFDERVTITLTLDPNSIADCTIDQDLILPGQDTFILTAGEQKFQVYRVRIECHSPATPEVVTMSIEKCIEIDDNYIGHDDDGDTVVDEDSRDGVDDDGDSEDGEDPPNPDGNPGNDCKTTEKQVIIS